jgi:23S rRNA (adenine2503-C2)-methyltransferase
VGCAVGCRFCATGRMGFVRHLRAAQIVDQLLHIDRSLAGRGERVTNVVLMGMGEPLHNYDQVVRAARLMRLEHGPAIGGRRITVSTSGYLPGIERLAQEDLNLGLAISLNATTDEVRQRLMPIGRKYRIAELFDAAREYFELRGRRVTFEYVLLDGVTDGDDDALRLADLTRDLPCKINLIPYNEPGPDGPFRRPPPDRLEAFRQLLESRAVRAVTVRDSQGQDIDAACGQLYQASFSAEGAAPLATEF